MNKVTATLGNQDTQSTPILHIAFELSNSKWKLALSDGCKIRQITIGARDLKRLEEEIGKARKKFCLEEGCRIKSCYEAGRDGFWLHRYLADKGIENIIVDSSSIEVNRRNRRAKTDRLDVESLLKMLIRYLGGERGLWSIVCVPGIEEEDVRRLHRELERLKKERAAHRNRIRSLFILHGIKFDEWGKLAEFLEKAETIGGQRFPEHMKREILREYERLVLLGQQIKELETDQLRQLEEAPTESHKMVKQLASLCGIGRTSAWVFIMEFFGWRKFKNRREIASLAGLTPTPYDSGGSQREQGISKAGNRRIRSMVVEIAWCWLRYQPGSKLSLWFHARFDGGKRMRRIGIVALARKLLIDMWRYLNYGIVPEGAFLKAA